MYGNSKHVLEPFKFNIYEIQKEMPNAEYHSRSEYSSSFLKTTHKHSVGKALSPIDQEMFALQFGDAFHEFMEIGNLSDRFAIKPGKDEPLLDEDGNIQKDDDGSIILSKAWNGATKEGKAWKAANMGKIILERNHIENIQGMHDSVMSIPLIKNLLEDESLERRDEWSFFADGDDIHTKGLKFRMRPDVHFYNKETGSVKCVIDWKTCNDLRKLIKWGFLGDFAYHVQAVFYCDVLGIDPRLFIFICVEKEPPYSARPFRLSDDTIEKARYDIKDVLVRINNWENNPKDNDIDLPKIVEI